MAANYTRSIEFVVKDSAIQRATKRLETSLKKIEKSVNEINQNLTAISKQGALIKVAKEVDEIGKSASRASLNIGFLQRELNKLTSNRWLNQGLVARGSADILKTLGLGSTKAYALHRAVADLSGLKTALDIAPVLISGAKAFASWERAAAASIRKATINFKGFAQYMRSSGGIGPFSLIPGAGNIFPGGAKISRPETGGGFSGMKDIQSWGEGALGGMYAPLTGTRWNPLLGKSQTTFPNRDKGLQELWKGLRAKDTRKGWAYSSALSTYFSAGGSTDTLGFPADEAEYIKQLTENVKLQKQINLEIVHRKRALEAVLVTENKIEDTVRKNVAASQKSRAASGGGYREFDRLAAAYGRGKYGYKKGAAVPGAHGFGAGEYGPQQPSMWDTRYFGRRAGRVLGNRRFRGATSSAMIGGGFPLLFGQGGTSAVGGGLGGALGGILGGGFGFGFSLIGTAIGQAMQKNDEFNQSLSVLNSRLTRVGGSAGVTAKEIDKMAKNLGVTKQQAMSLLTSFSAFDSKGVAAAFAGTFDSLGGAESLAMARGDRVAMANAIWSAREKIGYEKTNELLQQNRLVEAEAMQLALAVALREEKTRESVAQAKTVKNWERIYALMLTIQNFGTSAGPMKHLFNMRGGKQLQTGVVDPQVWGDARGDKVQKEADKGQNDWLAKLKKGFELILKTQNEFTKYTNQVTKLDNLYRQMGQTIENGIVNALEGAIRGTRTLGEVAASVLNQISRMILQYGVNSFLGSLFPNSETWGKIVGRRASGGPVTGGNPYVVGEKGPELFVPKSSGNIVPNNSMGVSMVVNVDASGSSAEGDDDKSRQLGELIGAAVQAEIIRQQRPGGTLY